jgi:DNA polymerase III delta prime subunit
MTNTQIFVSSSVSATKQKRSIVHVEVCLQPQSTAPYHYIENLVANFLLERCPMILSNGPLDLGSDENLRIHVKYAKISDLESGPVQLTRLHPPQIHVFKLVDDEVGNEELGPEQNVPACNIWLLPNIEFDGLWESLIFDTEIKTNLLEYISTAILFTDKQVDNKFITWNRVILTHGPPGTGKTSLCKALAQKIAIRLSCRYSTCQLIEINAHSLFSKWFSESGKLVLKMFEKIKEFIEDETSFVCVLIDEVESLTTARTRASENEPSDAIRVVNAVLTQLDQLKKYKNVVVLTTSNVTHAIDLAFVDRADIKQYIGPPGVRARYQILSTCLGELMRVGVIENSPLLDVSCVELLKSVPNDATRFSLKLYDVAKLSEGLSGRTLRKLPFLAHALYIQTDNCTLDEFLDALLCTIRRELSAQSTL